LFSAFLKQAQVAAINAEKKQVAQGGRKKQGKYFGTAPCTKRFQAQKGWESREAYARSGQQFITQWERNIPTEKAPVTNSGKSDASSDSESESSHEDIFDVDEACRAMHVNIEQEVSAAKPVSNA
jgi:hypothetical protein